MIRMSGIGHHQCSQRAVRPWPLSRPAQKTPSSTKTAPSSRPTRVTGGELIAALCRSDVVRLVLETTPCDRGSDQFVAFLEGIRGIWVVPRRVEIEEVSGGLA